MSLRLTAEADLNTIIEDSNGGFGWEIVLTNPSGVSIPLIGFSNDIAQIIDPDTGQAVSGRLASVVFRISSIYAQSFELPEGISDTELKPWLVEFNDINGLAYKFKVAQSNPDRALGVISCVLECYND